MERKKYQPLLGVTAVFPSCTFSHIKYKIQWSFMSSLKVSITSFYYKPFPSYTGRSVLQSFGPPRASSAAAIQLSPHGTGTAPTLLPNHQQLNREGGHGHRTLPTAVPHSITVTVLQQGTLVSFLAENIIFKKSGSISYLLPVIYFILLKICGNPWLWRLSNPLKCFLLKNWACIPIDPPLLPLSKLKL